MWWLATALVSLRVLLTQRYLGVYYLLACHTVKSAFLFVTPRGVPSIFEEEELENIHLPTSLE